MSESLRKITIKNLRGSTRSFSLSFDKGKKLTVIYGENGTGKSTICDAFEFIGNGKVGSVENVGLGRTNNQYWTSLGKQPDDVSVLIETSNNSYQGCIKKSRVIVSPSNNTICTKIFRRRQVLSLIEGTAGDRYEAIKPFLDVTGVEVSENNLNKLIKSLQDNKGLAVAAIQENITAIDNHWEVVGKPGISSLDWASIEIKIDRSDLEKEILYLANLQDAYIRLKESTEQVLNIEKTIDHQKKILLDADRRIAEIVDSISKDANEIVSILNAAKEYLDRVPNPTVCPLCESAEKVANLKTRVIGRLSDFTALQTANQDKNKAMQELQKTDHLKKANLDVFTQNHQTLFELLKEDRRPEDIQLPNQDLPSGPTELAEWFAATSAFPEIWNAAKTSRQSKKTLLLTLEKAVNAFEENVKKRETIDVILPRLLKALDIIRYERRKFTDSILSIIAVEVGRIYEAVHPGEGMDKISMALDPNQRASLNIGAVFCGQESPPQAYFSESHLDTLGLCIFLALSGMQNPEETILVLDDVLASVDEPHVDRLIEMLYGEAMKFQHCIITTHYRPWKQKLRWGWLKNGQCQFIELSKWTNNTGLTTIRSIPDIDSLRDLLSQNPIDPQLVCSKSGVILEAVLDFLTLLYECSVPRKPNELYTLGDLLPAINKKLRKSLKIEILSKNGDGSPYYRAVELGPILDELHRISQARNVFGCHFNRLAFELPEEDAQPFCNVVLALVDALVDPENGWPRSSRSGSYWATSGETRRLHPLKQPE